MTNIDDVRTCISNSSISCSYEIIHSMLTNKKIADVWWQLTDNERNILAEYIITHYLFQTIPLWSTGDDECIGGVNTWNEAVCVHNTIIRFMLLGKAETFKLTNCYYKLYTNDITRCYWSGTCFDLPVYFASIVSTAGSSIDFAHSICAIQIKEDSNSFNSWRFFQYDNSNIKPGNWQIPCGNGITIRVTINKLTYLECNGYSCYIKAVWFFTNSCCPSPTCVFSVT